MARLYTDRVMGSTAYAPPGVLNRSVPEGQSWCIRDMVVSFLGTAATYVTVQVVTLGDTYVIGHFLSEDGVLQHLDLRQTVRALERIDVLTDVDGPHMAMTAYKFLL